MTIREQALLFLATAASMSPAARHDVANFLIYRMRQGRRRYTHTEERRKVRAVRDAEPSGRFAGIDNRTPRRILQR